MVMIDIRCYRCFHLFKNKEFIMPAVLSLSRPYRAGITLLAFAWAFYCFGYIAALGAAILPAFVVSSVFAVPIAILLLLSRSVAATCMRVLLLLLAWIGAYSWLTIESALLLGPVERLDSVTSAQRHWPFANSAVVYVPEHGILWQD